MANWTVSTDKEFKEKYVEKLGESEFTRRYAIANRKADELENWEERTFMRAQFHSIAMQMSSEQFAKATEWTGKRWAKLVYLLAK